jgi:hypothetical protein
LLTVTFWAAISLLHLLCVKQLFSPPRLMASSLTTPDGFLPHHT